MRWLGICMLSLVFLSACVSTRWGQSELVNVCARTVDEDGYLRGRQATYNREGARLLLRGSRHSFRGVCNATDQGVQRRVAVCLVASSKCYHDRTTYVWPDEVTKYFERYPGSYQGACSNQAEDTCGQGHLFSVPAAFKLGCLQYDRVCQANKHREEDE